MTATNDRFSRQAGLIPTEKLRAAMATIIGVGAIGRQVALQLAALGVGKLLLIDHDTVDFSNVASQGYFWPDAEQQRPKVDAMRAAIGQIDPQVVVETICDRYRSKIDVGGGVFCCVDAISTRAAIWRTLEHRVEFWCDGRMLGEVARVLTVADSTGHNAYAQSLFAQDEAQIGSCTARSTIYAASIAAGFMVHSFARWLHSLPVEPDLTLNLLATELTVLVGEIAS